MLCAGGHGRSIDILKARMLFEAAAKAGNASAQYCIGLLHARGEGMPQDFEQAAQWYLLAAHNGLISAAADPRSWHPFMSRPSLG